jgi:signal transduction histidine kinase
MEVSDAGRGFNQEIQSEIASGESAGVGLRGMQESVKQIGGTLEISSAPGSDFTPEALNRHDPLPRKGCGWYYGL